MGRGRKKKRWGSPGWVEKMASEEMLATTLTKAPQLVNATTAVPTCLQRKQKSLLHHHRQPHFVLNRLQNNLSKSLLAKP
jgi:hypothetical protein